MDTVSLITLKDGESVKSKTNVPEAAALLSSVWQRTWGNQGKYDFWGESIACGACYTHDFDAPSASLTVLDEGRNLIPAHDLFLSLDEKTRQRICREPENHLDSIEHFWSLRRTEEYLSEHSGEQDLMVAVKEDAEGVVTTLGWFRGFPLDGNEKFVAGNVPLTSLLPTNQVYYVDTIGYDTSLDRRDKVKAFSTLAPSVLKTLIVNHYIKRQELIFRTHKEANHVKMFAGKFFDVELLGDAAENGSREYYRLVPNSGRLAKFVLGSLKDRITDTLIYKAVSNPRKNTVPVMSSLAVRAIKSDDQEGHRIGRNALEYIEANQEEIQNKLDDCIKDIKVCAALVVPGLLYSFVVAPAIAVSTRNPIAVALASIEGITTILPVFGGLPGLVRAAYLSARAVKYSNKYNYPLKSKLTLALASAFDLGWTLSPFLALKDEEGKLKELGLWNSRNMARGAVNKVKSTLKVLTGSNERLEIK